MAWRLNEMVARGVIDNREKGKVTGAIWLTGREVPIRLELDGNCEDDLAGCLVEFINRGTRPATSVGPFPDQVGATGTITASRKVRALSSDAQLEDLTREMIERAGWSNSLYLEWFSQSNGRVVVELVEPELRVSVPSWAFSEEEKEQRPAARERYTGFVHKVELPEIRGGDGKPNEFHYEKVLQSFDDYVVRFEELWERYRDDPDCDQKIANELGCILAHGDELGRELADEEFSEDADRDAGIAEYPEPLWFQHPLIVRAKDLCVTVTEFRKSREPNDSALRRLDELNQTLVQGMAKLADALHGLIEGSEHREPALLIALLKRSVSKYHKAIEILDRLPRKQVRVEIAQAWRAEILAIRGEILNEMNRLRQTE
jgi:hypothetical protein